MIADKKLEREIYDRLQPVAERSQMLDVKLIACILRRLIESDLGIEPVTKFDLTHHVRLLVLRANNQLERQLWDAMFPLLPSESRDMFYTSAYGHVQDQLGLGESMLLAMADGESMVIQPVMKRPTPWNGMFDLTSPPMGFGGPLPIGPLNFSLLEKFHFEVAKWAAAEQIVSQFCYCHPLLPVQGPVAAQQVRGVAQIDLTKNFTEQFSRRIRRGLKSAEEAKAKSNLCTAWPQFAEMYLLSMERKDAADHWRFDFDYIKQYSNLGRLYIAGTPGGAVRYLCIVSGYGVAYAHLLASNGLEKKAGLDELLYVTAARELKRDGFRTFFLGGGMTSDPDDSIFNFKSGFTDTFSTAYKYGVIYNQLAYERLVWIKQEAERNSFGDCSHDETFFPQYRRPMEHCNELSNAQA